MPNIGPFHYPDMAIAEVIRVAKRIAERKAVTASALASVLGHSSTSEKFVQALIDLKQYAIVESGGDALIVMGLARRLADGGEAAVAEAAFNVPLFDLLNSGFSGQKLASEGDVVAALQLLTGASERQIRPHAKLIMERLLEVAEYVGR